MARRPMVWALAALLGLSGGAAAQEPQPLAPGQVVVLQCAAPPLSTCPEPPLPADPTDPAPPVVTDPNAPPEPLPTDPPVPEPPAPPPVVLPIPDGPRPPAGERSRQASGDWHIDTGPRFGRVPFVGRLAKIGTRSTGKSNISPDYRSAEGCKTWNAYWDDAVLRDPPAGEDLTNPNNNGKVGWWVVRHSEFSGTTHVGGKHEDLIQVFGGPGHQGGWIVLQDVLIDRAGANGFIWLPPPTGAEAYGVGSPRPCRDDKGLGGIVWHDVRFGSPKPGGNLQVQLAGGKVPELWMIGVTYGSGVGFDLRNDIAKVIVVGGSTKQKTDGWPGPLKPMRAHDNLTEKSCAPGGWKGGKCCPNGLVNRNGERFSNLDPADRTKNSSGVKFYCYDTIARALRDHAEPPMIRHHDVGW